MDVCQLFFLLMYVFVCVGCISNDKLLVKRDVQEEFCGGIYVNSSGVIRLPTRDDQYKPFLDCRWEITVDIGHQIAITSSLFAVEYSTNCLWDYLEIRDGIEEGDAVQYRFCGYNELGMLSSYNKLYLYFVSDGYAEDRGFELKYTAVPKTSACSRSVLAEANIYSPNYPKDYPPNTNCLYLIQAPHNKRVELDIKDVRIADDTCLFDRLDVYDGVTTYSTKIGEVCGNTYNGKFVSSGRSMFLYFRSDYYEERRGFRATVKFINADLNATSNDDKTNKVNIPAAETTRCSNISVEGKLNGTVTSPGFPNYYKNNEYCVTIIKAPLPNHQIRLNVTFLEVEDSPNCTFDSITIYETGAEDSKIIGKLCGISTESHTYISSGGNMRVEFKSDDMITEKGFEATFQVTPKDLCYPLCDPNSEVCVFNNGGHSCVAGTSCDINICDHGACVRTAMAYTCYCPEGYDGPFCDAVKTMKKSMDAISFTKAPESRSVRRGSRLILECTVTDHGAEYTWLFEDLMLQTDNRITVYPGGVLDISNFQEEFEGSYKCVASTTSDFAVTAFRLNLVEQCKLNVELPPRDTLADVGSTSLFSCFVPSAKQVIWKVNGNNITKTRFSVIGKGFYLKIENVKLEDEGQYKCVAESEDGCYIERSARLSVNKADDSVPAVCGGKTTMNIIPRLSSRISGGRAVASGSIPWHVILREKNKGKTFCGGTLISDTWIATAAHCIGTFPVKFKEPFNPANIELAMGTDSCSGDGGVKRHIKQYVLHKDFGKRAIYDYDIALIEMDYPVNFTDRIQPICMKQVGVINNLFLNRKVGRKVGRVVGCGQLYENVEETPEKIHDVFVPNVNRELCAKAEIGSGNFTDTMFCAGYDRALFGDACYGDSGGSLTMKVNENDPWIFVGIVSWGVGCDRPGHYGYYTNVAHFYDWIHNVTATIVG